MNYVDSFILVADDCSAEESAIPKERGGKKTVALIQYEMLSSKPYKYTQEDVLFETHVRHKGVPAAELKANGKKLREEFFAKEQPCLRTSPLARRYGFGFHFDSKGRVALYPIESQEYRKYSKQASNVINALRTKRK